MRKFDTDFYSLKAATTDLIARCGGQPRAGAIVGVSQQHMSRIAHRDDGSMLTIIGKLALENECGEPLLTRAEAKLLGYRLERDGEIVVQVDGCALSAHAAVMQEVGDLCRAFADAQRDGRYSRTDAVTVGRELADLRRAIERFERVNLATMAGGGS
jgi:hypothetical protein